ncbi:DUF5986 family protein [Lactobacillus helveticus]|uniref:DUF5986 family protein n=1 Tax=Lactobacillus helveticus TaxID=1587 RepID=UPI0021A96458|nr:DUF5986 family protein [Lactobacillus helveticus]MCT3412747.1 hypothetical protein [Lactobacillus helveticus]MCT3416413.1 hypothetical protein [Lactobacillus helveticus]MCT3426852.1 hypothetical protein [Lactobacillus helveticus]
MDKLKRDDEVLRRIVPGATVTMIQVKDDYTEEVGGKYINGLSFNVWDHRFNTISAAIASTPWLAEIPIDRHIWKAIGVFNTKDGTLYLITSYANFIAVQRKIKKGKYSHYMYPLTINNATPTEQLSLDGFENDNAIAEERLREAKKILGDDFTRLKRTIIITYDYFEDEAVNGLEILVDNNFSIIDRLVIPEYKSPSSDDSTTKYDNQEKFAEKQKSDRIVKWNANKIRRPITGEENNNGTSN